MALGERITLQGLSGERSRGCVLVPLGHGYAVVYRFGCVLLFDVDEPTGEQFLTQIRSRVVNAFARPVVETAELVVDAAATKRVAGDIIVVASPAPDTLRVVGDVLAKSVALEHYEQRISETFEKVEPLTTQLARTGRTGRSSKVLIRHIASVLLAEHALLGRIEVVDKPDLLWEKPEFERLYDWLVDEYEIRERHVALERKLGLLSKTAQTLLNLLHSSRSLRVEWYIVALIVIEVALMLFYEWR
jgi:uncharacterized Rmd1/YagE family protein